MKATQFQLNLLAYAKLDDDKILKRMVFENIKYKHPNLLYTDRLAIELDRASPNYGNIRIIEKTDPQV